MADEENNKNTNETADVPEEPRFDWDQLFADEQFAEDITRSDERKEINLSKDFINQQRKSYIKFDGEFQKFLQNYVEIQYEKEKQKLYFKDQFFWFIMIGFLVLIITPVIIILSANDLSDTSMVVALISVLVEMVSAIIVLPKIIADYLFNKEEDKNMTEIIKSMQSYNEKKHDHFVKR